MLLYLFLDSRREKQSMRGVTGSRMMLMDLWVECCLSISFWTRGTGD